MDTDLKTTAAVLAALRLAQERGGAAAALAQSGVRLPSGEGCNPTADGYEEVLGEAFLDDRLAEAVALGFLAGRLTPRRRHRGLNDVTAFVMDHHLVVRAAEGESILRLPWFEEELFVGRQLPDIGEIPATIRLLATESYRAALAGERNEYAFTSYGHGYAVDAVPLRGGNGAVEGVMAIATPTQSPTSAAEAVARRAQRREAELLRSNSPTRAGPALSTRELQVLTLASHGLSYSGIAEQLVISVATVKTHLAHIYAKLQVADKAAAVARGLREGLIA
jgi:DNA-binding CsgD family transcriptional regulator